MTITKHHFIAILAVTAMSAAIFWMTSWLPVSGNAKSALLLIAWFFGAVAAFLVVMTVYHLVRGSRRS